MKPRTGWVRWLVAGLGLGASAGALVVGFFVVRPIPLPETEVGRARRACSAARLQPGVRPQDLAAADSLSAILERGFAVERAKWVRFRRPVHLVRTAEALVIAAARAESTAVSRRRSEARNNQVRGDQLQQRLDRLSAKSSAVPGSQRLSQARLGAQLALGVAGRLEAQGQFTLVADQLDSAEAMIDRVRLLLDRRTGRLRDPEMLRRWQAWVDETITASARGETTIVINKQSRSCMVLQRGRVVACYDAELGRNGLADKLYAGDGATPEGRYRIAAKNAASRFHRALLLDYPDATDRARHREAAQRGLVPAGSGPGGLIEIHGRGGRGIDWTDGCVALRDRDVEDLFAMVEVGARVTIVGAARLPGD